MEVFVALIGAVNVGGTGVLPMQELRALCTGVGLENVRTHIQSGNVVFASRLAEADIRTRLEQALTEKMGKKMGVFIRTAAELRSVLDRNPFTDAPPSKVVVLFLHNPPPKALLDTLLMPGREELRLGTRELYIHYPDGMGRSKLKLPSRAAGTARNINTVAKLVAMTGT